jgi:hypothetical protein
VRSGGEGRGLSMCGRMATCSHGMIVKMRIEKYHHVKHFIVGKTAVHLDNFYATFGVTIV